MTQIRLSARLECIANLIPPFGGVVDVGTDHGYIPVWLLQNGYEGKIFATDIKKGPLEHAKKTAYEFGFENEINFYQCDGLEALDGEEINTVIIAGMGGENISSILSKAAWTRENNCLLILQPMSKSQSLRKWLFNNGYKVLSEQLVEDSSIYEILTVMGGTDIPYSPAELIMGHIHLITSDPLFALRLNGIIDKYKKAESGLSLSTKNEDKERLSEIRKTLESLRNLQRQLK